MRLRSPHRARGAICGGKRRGHQRHEVDASLGGGEVLEPLHERQREQEREQDLRARLGHPQLLQQLAEVAVQPLLGGLPAGLPVPVLIATARLASYLSPRPGCRSGLGWGALMWGHFQSF
jgi:hypothetical protein